MPSPNFDILHTRFANSIEDPVATAGTAGVQFTVAQRSGYINRAIQEIQTLVYEGRGKDEARRILQSQVDSQAVSFASAGVAVEASYINKPLSLTKSGSTSIFMLHPRKEELDTNVNPNISAAYVIEAGKIYAYESGVILNSGTGTFLHLGKDEGTQGTTDVLITQDLWDYVVDLAVILALEESGELQSSASRTQRFQVFNKILAGM